MEKYLTKKQDKLSLIYAILLITSVNLFAQSSKDLFQSVFGTDSGNSIPSFPVPFYLDNQYSSEILLYYDSQNENVEIEASKTMEILSPRLREETIELLKTHIDVSKDTINLAKIDESGLETYYNIRELALFIDIPSDLQREYSINLKGNKSSSQGETLLPSPFSAYLNYYSSINLNISGIPDDREYKLPFSLLLDTAINNRSYVFEGDILFSYNDYLSVSDWNASVVKDIKEKNLRLRMGTIVYPVTQLQGYIPLNGMVLGKNFKLDPTNNIQSLGRQSLILQEPSKIEIFVNGRLLKKLDLPKGRYQLENLQLDTGSNFVEVKIEGLTGKEETLYFSQAFNIGILKKGLSDYSAAFGINENNMDEPVLTSYYRYGVNEVFTLGANIQSDFSMFNGGLSFLLGTSAGNFSLESSLSYDDGFDWAASFFYRYTNSRFPNKNNWSFSASYRGENYNGLRLEKVSNTTPLRLSFYYGQILPGSINAGLTFNRDYLSNWDEGSTELALHLSKHFGNGLLMNFYASDKIFDDGESDFVAGLTLTVNLQKKNETLTSSASWPGTTIENNWQKSSPTRVPGYNVNLGISGLPTSVENTPYGFTFGGEYRGYRFTSSMNHNSSILNTNDQSLHNSSINFSSAFVYADSTFALSRPVYDSFVIIIPTSSFEEYTIGINPEGNSYGALLNGKGNAVLPGLRSYRNNQVLFEAIDLPIGYDLGESSYSFQPSYKSGSVIRVGSDAVLFAGGILVDETRKPYPLTALLLKSQDRENQEEKMFFTNRDGYFELYGLTEGLWTIELMGDRNLKTEISIPSDITGYYNLWDVILKREVTR